MKPIPAAMRDTILFVTGLGLIINEALFRNGPDRYGMLVLFAGMVGLPVVLRGDERLVSPPTSPPPSLPPPPPPASSGPPAPTGGMAR